MILRENSNFDRIIRTDLAYVLVLSSVKYLPTEKLESVIKERKVIQAKDKEIGKEWNSDKFRDNYRAPLNQFIMELLDPYVETIRTLSEQLEMLTKLDKNPKQ